MANFMDVHSGFFGVTAEQLKEAHERDLAIEREEGVHFERAWLDPEKGKVFCLASGPSLEARIVRGDTIAVRSARRQNRHRRSVASRPSSVRSQALSVALPVKLSSVTAVS